MTKKRVIEAELTASGWRKLEHSRGPHDKFVKEGRRSISVPRHRELDDTTANEIRKQAGLR